MLISGAADETGGSFLLRRLQILRCPPAPDSCCIAALLVWRSRASLASTTGVKNASDCVIDFGSQAMGVLMLPFRLAPREPQGFLLLSFGSAGGTTSGALTVSFGV